MCGYVDEEFPSSILGQLTLALLLGGGDAPLDVEKQPTPLTGDMAAELWPLSILNMTSLYIRLIL